MFPGSVQYWPSRIYTLKIELMLMGNAEISEMSGAIWCFNNFEANLCIQLWLTAYPAFNNIYHVRKLSNYEESAITTLGRKLISHSRYLWPEHLQHWLYFHMLLKFKRKGAWCTMSFHKEGNNCWGIYQRKWKSCRCPLFKKLRISVHFSQWKSGKTTQASLQLKTCVKYFCVNDCAGMVIMQKGSLIWLRTFVLIAQMECRSNIYITNRSETKKIVGRMQS